MFCRFCGREIPEGYVCDCHQENIVNNLYMYPDDLNNGERDYHYPQMSECQKPINSQYQDNGYNDRLSSPRNDSQPHMNSVGLGDEEPKGGKVYPMLSLVFGLISLILPFITSSVNCSFSLSELVRNGTTGSLDALAAIISFVCVVLGVLAVIFGVQGRKNSNGKRMATAGLVLGIIGIVFAAISLSCWSCDCVSYNYNYDYRYYY